MRGGGRRGGRGRGKGREGGSGRRDARPRGAAASRDDRDRRPDSSPHRRRTDCSPRRRNDYIPRHRNDNDYSPRGRSPHVRSPSPDWRARRPMGEENHDREVTRGNRGPTRGSQMSHGGDHSPPPGRGDYNYQERGRCEDHSDDHDLPRHRRRDDYDDGYHDLPRHVSRDDYAGVRDLPRNGHRNGYESVPYRDREDRGATGPYNARPAYMLPDDRPSSLHGGRKESDYFGGPGDRGLNRDSKYAGSPGRRSTFKERELLEGAGMTLRISATELGRTTALYPEQRRSPPSRPALSPPPPLYPSVPPTDSGFLARGSDVMAGDGFGTGSTRLLHDDSRFKYDDHLRDSYVERSRGTERHYSGSRDVLVKEDRGTNRLYHAADMPIHGDIDADRLYSSRGMLGSDLVPCTQLKQIGDSSTSMLKDSQYRMHSEPDFEQSNGYARNDLGILPHDSSRYGGVRACRFSLLEHGSDHGDETLLDFTRQEHSKLGPRAEPMEYDGHEYASRDPILDKYVATEDLRVNVPHNPGHILGSPSLTGFKDERINHHLRLPYRMEEDEDSYQDVLHDSEHNRRDSYHVRASVRYPPARGGSDHYSYSPGFEPTARRPAHQREFASFEDDRDLSDRDVSPMTSRKRYRSPASYHHEMDMHQADDGFAGRGYYDTGEYDPSPRRMSRSYDMVDEDEYDARYDMPNNRNVFSRLALPHENGGGWTDAEQEGHTHSSTLAYGRSKHKPVSQRLSGPIAHSKFGGPSVQGRGKGVLTMNGKKKMRLAQQHFDGGYTSPRNEFVRANKYRKSSEEDNPNELGMDHEHTPEGEDLPLQKDPPEGSEEFTKQVHDAFLKYTKMINESPAMQKKFRDAAKGSLSCCVCGSVARKFQDLDALVSHAYNTCKVGLKTKHLGFHKALCVLMGWNWRVAPSTSKSHHSIPVEEVNAMKGDLLLWPPVVVIHNSSIAIKTKDTESKIVSKEEIEGLLADIGIPLEKANVIHGSPANGRVFLVKFQHRISGLQEAIRIHDHFSAKKHGKEEFREMRGTKGKQAAGTDNLDEVLYAHIAVAEDLRYLDEETKRRCVIRSKKDIEAMAEATLNVEP